MVTSCDGAGRVARRMLGAAAGLAATMLMAAASEAAPTHAHSSGAAAMGELGADAVFLPSGELCAVHKVSGHVAVSRSNDAGASWGNPVLVTRAPESTDPGGDARPKIAAGPRGEIYLTWTRPLEQPYTGEIVFCRSTDDGRSFTPPQVVHRDQQRIGHRFDALAVNAHGQVLVAWLDKRRQRQASNAIGASVYFAVSDDRGATFRGDYEAAPATCECCRIALVSDGDEFVALWRHLFEPNVRDHALARIRPDGTVAALERASFENWAINACPHHGPALAIDNARRLHAVWFSGAESHHGVFYRELTQTPAPSDRRIGTVAAQHADLAADGESVAIAWKESDGGTTRLRGSLSRDGGRTWHDCELAGAKGPTAHPRVLSHHGRFYVLWNSASASLAVFPFPTAP